MSDPITGDGSFDSREEFCPLVDTGGGHIPWDAMTPRMQHLLTTLCCNVEVALRTEKPLRHVRALPNVSGNGYVRLKVKAHWPIGSLSTPQALPAPASEASTTETSTDHLDLSLDPVVRELCGYQRRMTPAWLTALQRWQPLAFYLAWGSVIVFVAYCYRNGAVQ